MHTAFDAHLKPSAALAHIMAYKVVILTTRLSCWSCRPEAASINVLKPANSCSDLPKGPINLKYLRRTAIASPIVTRACRASKSCRRRFSGNSILREQEPTKFEPGRFMCAKGAYPCQADSRGIPDIDHVCDDQLQPDSQPNRLGH
jgi:hypothetical protein